MLSGLLQYKEKESLAIMPSDCGIDLVCVKKEAQKRSTESL